MKFHRHFLALPALCIFMFAAAADETDPHTLTVAAGTPEVSVQPQPPGRRSLSLPSLDYAFSVEARCPDDWAPASLSLNVADSRISKAGKDLENQVNQQLDITVPARQLAPLTLRDFCVIDPADEGSVTPVEKPVAPPRVPGSSRLRLVAALAHASLRCTRDDQEKTVYVSQPLDVTLICDASDDEGAVTAR